MTSGYDHRVNFVVSEGALSAIPGGDGDGGLPDSTRLRRVSFYNMASLLPKSSLVEFLRLVRMTSSSRSIGDNLTILENSLPVHRDMLRNYLRMTDEAPPPQVQHQQGGGEAAAAVTFSPSKVAETLQVSLNDRIIIMVVLFLARAVSLSLASTSLDSGATVSLEGAYVVYAAVKALLLAGLSGAVHLSTSTTIRDLLYGVLMKWPAIVFGSALLDAAMLVMVTTTDGRMTEGAGPRDSKMNISSDLSRVTAVTTVTHMVLMSRL